jgi:hypothetical protein
VEDGVQCPARPPSQINRRIVRTLSVTCALETANMHTCHSCCCCCRTAVCAAAVTLCLLTVGFWCPEEALRHASHCRCCFRLRACVAAVTVHLPSLWCLTLSCGAPNVHVQR